MLQGQNKLFIFKLMICFYHINLVFVDVHGCESRIASCSALPIFWCDVKIFWYGPGDGGKVSCLGSCDAVSNYSAAPVWLT